VLCASTKFNNHIISRRFEEQIHKIEITLYCIYFNYNIMNQIDVIEDTINFMVDHNQHSCRANCNFYTTEYNIKLLNNGKKIIVNILFTFDDYYSSYQSNRKVNKTEKILYDDDIQLSKSQIELLKNIYKPYYNIKFQCENIRYIYTGIHNILKPDDILNDFCEIINFLKKNKDAVFTRDEFNSLEKNARKELKETENKLKETENKLKDSDNKLKETENKLKETVDKFLLLQNTHNDLIINNNNIKNNYINDIKITINKFKSESAILNDDFNKKTTELLNKNSRIQSNNLEITIENKKLSRQLEDITELYELLLTKQSDNKLEETENKLKESNDKLEETENKLKESNDKLEETKNKLTEIHELYNFVLYHTKETDNKLTESNDKLEETENKLKESNDKLEKTENELKESINNMQFYESLLTKQNEKLKETENKLKEVYDKQQKDENSGWGILSLFFQK